MFLGYLSVVGLSIESNIPKYADSKVKPNVQVIVIYCGQSVHVGLLTLYVYINRADRILPASVQDHRAGRDIKRYK